MSNSADTNFSIAIDDDDLLDCFVNLPDSESKPFVLDYKVIKDAQDRDAFLQAIQSQTPDSYPEQLLAPEVHLICYIAKPDSPWKIYLPGELMDNSIHWYDLALGHIGQN
jgi:hypothetical protein